MRALDPLVLVVLTLLTTHSQPSFQALEPYVGAYRMTDGTLARVMLRQGGLVYREADVGTPIRMIAAQTFEGTRDARPVRLTFSPGELASSVTIRSATGARVGQRVTVALPLLQAHVGVYPLSESLAMQVTLEHGQLHAQAPGGSKHPLFPESDTRFFVHDYGTDDVADLEFGHEASGAAFVIVSQGGASQKVARK